MGEKPLKDPKGPKDNVSTKPVKEKKEKVKKPIFGLVLRSDDKVYPFTTALPSNFEFGKYQGLKKPDFAEDYLYIEHKVEECKIRLAKLETEAAECKKLGSSKQRAKVKRLVKMQEQYAALKEQLEAQGIDVNDILGGDEEASE